MKRQADEKLEGAPPSARRPINSPEPEREPELEQQPTGSMDPEEVLQEGPSTSGCAPNPEDQPEEPQNPVEPSGEVAPENVEQADESEVLPDDHPSNFFANQIRRLRGLDPRELRFVKIHSTRIRETPTSTVVIPRIFVLIGYQKGETDLIHYRPSGDCQEDCAMKRRWNREEMIVRNQNYQDVLKKHLHKFLMTCGDLCTTVEKLALTVDPNPLIPTDRLSWRTNDPHDSFLEQFRDLCRQLDHETLLIKDIDIESRFRPLREGIELAQFAPCVNVTVRPMRFERENVEEVMQTIGVFGNGAMVNHWHIRASDDIDLRVRRSIRVPGFTVYTTSPMEIVFSQEHADLHRSP